MDLNSHANPTIVPAKRRKPRPKLSCVPCRQKKLKCNRLHPCDNCIKYRRAYSCHYVGAPGISNRQGIQSHLHDLEARIQQLSAVDAPSHPQPDPQTVAWEEPSEQTDLPGTMLREHDGTIYRNPNHWQALLNEIAEVKEYLQLTTDTSPEEENEEVSLTPDLSGPVLLFANCISTTKDELLAALPVRSDADRLVSVYLNSKESTLVIMHIPTFAREYAGFWRNPSDVTISWLAYLFGILCACTGLHLFSTSGRADGDLAEKFDAYHRRASQCLAMSVYTTPGRYKLEALILSVASEILRSTDTHVGPSALLGLATRLALHSGYHRDPKHFRGISVFEGEMRRRIWMYLSLLDHYISLQAGLPPSTNQVQSDTDEPRNLTDEDLDPAATALPPARPWTEKTPILFPVVLNRIMFAAAEITRRVYSVKGIPYREVLHLDANLHELHATVPVSLRFRPLEECIADPPTAIMDRYNVDLMYQKARCDLHRRYLAHQRWNPTYAYSRRQCLDAARTVLRHQSDIFDASAPGSQLGCTSFFFSSCVVMHFRVAAMIISLEISCQSRYDLLQELSASERQTILADRQQLCQELTRSYAIWNHLRPQSKEAATTADALQIMLKIANTHLQHGATLGQDEPSVPSTGADLMPVPIPMPPSPTDPDTPDRIHQHAPADVDLMNAIFYPGPDELVPPKDVQLAGPTDAVDFYDRYWENLLFLGGDLSFGETNLEGIPGNSGDVL
ncbi:hypothetical protein EYZ11_007259 [Aspergillus tanneri]|uniref:Zn(2)-C6 fungal-type domain-containing protein n=1 Tax=Aspergillus tanneri TaxID=1220188 RepID=A0A4S3JDF1_9EURO|nr:uncharacterized protein ATNIH1004_009737 [Aspergillus tanneri]KAA8642975.1 hypothetical protein ATNIH1004_009737 [Aspergillus tanneri]THC93273.1 hypothetical protein EYZ11_007259 [Aspergillus tanneri]